MGGGAAAGAAAEIIVVDDDAVIAFDDADDDDTLFAMMEINLLLIEIDKSSYTRSAQFKFSNNMGTLNHRPLRLSTLFVVPYHSVVLYFTTR